MLISMFFLVVTTVDREKQGERTGLRDYLKSTVLVSSRGQRVSGRGQRSAGPLGQSLSLPSSLTFLCPVAFLSPVLFSNKNIEINKNQCQH
jgi:hypothetical protein